MQENKKTANRQDKPDSVSIPVDAVVIRKELLSETFTALIHSPCKFWACEGFKEPPKTMITCEGCRTIYNILQEFPELQEIVKNET